MRALLFSSATNPGERYLEEAHEDILRILGGLKRVLFFPFARRDWDAYAKEARLLFGGMGVDVASAHETDILSALHSKKFAVFVGGGNTFRLVNQLRLRGYFGAIREVVASGVPYIGVSAGTNLACPTIMTTNDMPIVNVASFLGLDLVPYQVNPHHPEPGTPRVGDTETREDRIREYHEENTTSVVGLREGSWILVEDGKSVLRGPKRAVIFEPRRSFGINPGEEIPTHP